MAFYFYSTELKLLACNNLKGKMTHFSSYFGSYLYGLSLARSREPDSALTVLYSPEDSLFLDDEILLVIQILTWIRSTFYSRIPVVKRVRDKEIATVCPDVHGEYKSGQDYELLEPSYIK